MLLTHLLRSIRYVVWRHAAANHSGFRKLEKVGQKGSELGGIAVEYRQGDSRRSVSSE